MDTPYSLRGLPAKQRFVAEYDVHCVLYSALLPGRQVTCCCGNSLGGKYYRFRYAKDGKGLGYFYAGLGCGKVLQEASLALGQDIGAPQYFDPLDLFSGQTDTQTTSPDDGLRPGIQRKSGNREMIAAISLLFYFWEEERTGYLFSVRDSLQNDPGRLPSESAVCSLNKAIRNTAKLRGKTLRQMLVSKCQEARTKGKVFHFEYLENIISNRGETCLL